VRVLVVPISGGKDSTTVALWLKENEPADYVYVCTPTGDELPPWWAHMRHMRDILGSDIIPVMRPGGLKGLIEHYKALPNWRQRWCTRELKIETFAAWLLPHAPATVYVGLRADEPEREGGDYSAVPGITMRCPLREAAMCESDVLAFLEQRGIQIPERTDCARCWAQRIGEWWVLWREYPEIYADAEADESLTGHTFRSPGRDTWPASLAELRLRFEAGEIPQGAKLQGDLFRNNLACRVCRL
jgi:hypothetical protein